MVSMPRGRKPKQNSTKQEIIDSLKEQEKLEGYNNVFLVVELEKRSGDIGVIHGEVLQNDKILFRGTFSFSLKTMKKPNDWTTMKVHEKAYFGLTVDYKGQTLAELFIDGLKTSIGQGRIPFFSK
jgi:hypothetical protein